METSVRQLPSRPKIAGSTLIILYLVGLVALIIDLHPDFIFLTPVNLLLSVILMLWAHREWSVRFLLFLLATYCWGFFAELAGVQTGLIFGSYAYGEVLGPKLWGTPLMIGVNWVLVTYTAGVWINHLFTKQHWLLRGIAGSLLLVMLDLIIEPVAIAFGFWNWEAGIPPIHNYLGWFLVALPLQLIFARFFGSHDNIVARILFILQVAFFAILAITNA